MLIPVSRSFSNIQGFFLREINRKKTAVKVCQKAEMSGERLRFGSKVFKKYNIPKVDTFAECVTFVLSYPCGPWVFIAPSPGS
jgi:hypothetical protein